MFRLEKIKGVEVGSWTNLRKSELRPRKFEEKNRAELLENLREVEGKRG